MNKIVQQMKPTESIMQTMLSRSKTAIYFILLITALTGHTAAADRLEVEVRSNILNIRETTSTKSPVIEALKAGDRLTVTTTAHPDWIRLDDDRGFISIHYVNILSRTPVIKSPTESTEQTAEDRTNTTTLTTPSLCQAGPKNTQLELTAQTKTCRKNLQTLGYESCELLFNITLRSSCSENSPVEILCQAEVISKAKGTTDKIKTELSTSRLIHLSETTTSTLLLSWSPGKTETAITEIKLNNARCALNDVLQGISAAGV